MKNKLLPIICFMLSFISSLVYLQVANKNGIFNWFEIIGLMNIFGFGLLTIIFGCLGEEQNSGGN